MEKFDGAGDRPEEDDPEHEAEVADAVAEEGLAGGVGGGGLLVPEADQEVGADADQFPEDEHHQEIRRHDDADHREDEEGELGEEAADAGIVVHVTEREDVDEEADAGDDEEHQLRERIDEEADLDLEPGELDPGEGGGGGDGAGEEAEGDQEGDGDGPDGEAEAELLEGAGEAGDGDGGEERCQEEEPSHRD